ncbi:hypothetical protein N0V91_007613 [Didymella pomorum]|uniref:Uncharacterized protein n=1 Tax=Didymella pomorum TaxID=749634 RepID=A0A9W8ZAM6_9PLEO|nr:hypothetical protein N0V91_007613 [Didymella pomorum]
MGTICSSTLKGARLRIDEDEGERTEEWRPYATYLISDFFKDMVRNFEQLELASYFDGYVRFGEQADDEIK